MMKATIERQGSSYRQGLVLGFTMAEALLLLIFCLLIATGASLTHERKRNTQSELRRVEAERNLADSSAALRELTKVDRVGELLIKRGGVISPAAVDDLWKRLTTSLDVIEELELEGKTVDLLKRNAERAEQAALGLSQEADAFASAQAALAQVGAAGMFKAEISTLLQEAIAARAAKQEGDGKGPGIHDWPPIINLSEAGGYYFAKGSAELTQKFARELEGIVIPRLISIIDQYKVDLVEVVGHTDEQQIAARTSNLDKEMLGVVRGTAPMTVLRPADNAGLGLARAVAITRALSVDSRLAGVRVLPMSGAQLIDIGERLASGTNQGDVQERRRIEIRVRKSVD